MQGSTLVFVTGGTGFIGTKLVTELVQKGHIIPVLTHYAGGGLPPRRDITVVHPKNG